MMGDASGLQSPALEDPPDYQSLLLDLLGDVGTVIANDKAGAGAFPTAALGDDSSLSLLELPHPSTSAAAAAPAGHAHHEHHDSTASAGAMLSLDMLSLQQQQQQAQPFPPPSRSVLPLPSLHAPQQHQQHLPLEHLLSPSAAQPTPQPSLGVAPAPLPHLAAADPLAAAAPAVQHPSAWLTGAAWPSGGTWAPPAVPPPPPRSQGSGPLAPLPPWHPAAAGSAPTSATQPLASSSQSGGPQQQHAPPPRRPSQDGRDVAAAAPTSGQRRKRPTSTQVVAELQAQVAQQVALAKQLSMNNIWLAERMRIMELVIAVRAGQVARVHEIRKGLDFNPFVGFRSSVQEMRDASPSKVADKLLELTGGMAMRLAAIQPLLQTNPHLLALSQPAGPVPPARQVFDPSRPRVAPPLPPLFDFTHAHMLPELQQLIVEMEKMQLTYSFLNLIHPHMLRVGNLNLQALQDSTVSWDSLVETMSQQATTAPAPGAGGLTQAQLPTIAPEVQWVKLAESLRLSDLQRLRAAALWDIISTARKSVLQQRAHLAQAVAQVLLHAQGADANDAHGPVQPPTARSSGGASPAPSHSPASSSHHPPAAASSLHAAPSAAHSGSSSGRLTGGGAEQGAPQHASSEALSGGVGGVGQQGRLEGQVRAVLSKSPAALQQEAALMEKLQYNLIKERCLITIAAETMFRFIFSPVQNAVALVSAYPFVVDQMAVLHAAALEFQPAVLDRLVASLESAQQQLPGTSPGMALPMLPSAPGSGPVAGNAPPPAATATAARPAPSASATRGSVSGGTEQRHGAGGGAGVMA